MNCLKLLALVFSGVYLAFYVVLFRNSHGNFEKKKMHWAQSVFKITTIYILSLRYYPTL